MKARIGLLSQPEPMRSIVGATQQEQRFDWVGAVRRMRTRIRLQAQPESMRSIVGATQ